MTQYGITGSERFNAKRTITIRKSREIHTQKVLQYGYTAPRSHLYNLKSSITHGLDLSEGYDSCLNSECTYRIQGITHRKKRLVVHFDRLKPYRQHRDPHPDTELADTPPSHQPASDNENATSNFGDHLQTVQDDSTSGESTQIPPMPTKTTGEIAGHCQALNVGHILRKREQRNESPVPKHPINTFCTVPRSDYYQLINSIIAVDH